MDILIYLFFIGLIFIIFFFLISILGYFFLFIFKKRFSNNQIKEDGIKQNLSFLEQFFISFGIGVAVYISLGYFLDLFKLFNFYTAYLSIVIFDLGFFLFYLYYNKNQVKDKFNKNFFKERFIKYFSNKNNLICLGFLIFIIILSTITQVIIITDSTSLIYTDPFKGYQAAFYLIDNGHIDYKYLDYNYPSGYTFFNAGVLLIYPDYIFGYYYFKLMSLIFLPLYLIVAFIIVKKLFKRNYLVFLSLFFIIISRYFIARTMLYISSTIASLILIIAIIVIINKLPDYIMGFFVVGLYLIHNLTAFYFVFVLILYYGFKFLLNLKNREILLKQFYSILLALVIIIIIIIPYLLSIYFIYNDTFLDFIKHFFGRFDDSELSINFKYSNNRKSGLLRLVFPLEFFKPFIESNLLDIFDEFFERSIYLFFIFSILGLFIYNRPKRSNKDIQILVFFKLFIIITIIFFFLPYFIRELYFFEEFRKRIMQSFSLPLIIMAIYAIEWIVNKAKIITEYLSSKFDFYRNLVKNEKFYSKFLKIESIIVIILLTSMSSTYYMHRWPDYQYTYEDELVDVVLYLRDKAEPSSKILHQDFDSEIIFRMLYDMNVKTWHQNKSSTYEELLYEIQKRDIDYLIFPKDYFYNGGIEDYISHNPKFIERLENDEYILFKIRT